MFETADIDNKKESLREQKEKLSQTVFAHIKRICRDNDIATEEERLMIKDSGEFLDRYFEKIDEKLTPKEENLLVVLALEGVLRKKEELFGGKKVVDKIIAKIKRENNRHRFDFCDDEIRRELIDQEVDVKEFLATIDDNQYRDEFADLIAESGQCGDFKIFSRDGFPVWKDAEKAFIFKNPVVCVKSGYIFSGSGKFIHDHWRELLYAYYNDYDFSENRDGFIDLFMRKQGYYRSSSSNKWYVHRKLIESHPEIYDELEGVEYTTNYEDIS